MTRGYSVKHTRAEVRWAQGKHGQANGSIWSLFCGCATLLLAVVALFLPDVALPQGGLVGWLLVASGILEIAFGSTLKGARVGVIAKAAGLVTALAGVVFVFNPSATYFPVANVVMIWLAIRGALVLSMAMTQPRPLGAAWLSLSGGTDILLALVLVPDFQGPISLCAIRPPKQEVCQNSASSLQAAS